MKKWTALMIVFTLAFVGCSSDDNNKGTRTMEVKMM